MCGAVMHRFWQRKEEDDSMVAQDVERPDISAIRFGAGGNNTLSSRSPKNQILLVIDKQEALR